MLIRSPHCASTRSRWLKLRYELLPYVGLSVLLSACFVDGAAVVPIDRAADAAGIDAGVGDASCMDIDRDGVCDDRDRCPGFDDSLDMDGDGAPDFCDECPEDPLKVDMGACGCAFSDADTDGDGRADCVDDCAIDGPTGMMGIGGAVTEGPMTIQPGEWMSAGPIGGPIPSNPVPTVNPGQAMRLSLDYEVGPGACIGCAKQGELGLEGESEILDCAFDRVAAIDVSGVAILEFSAPLEPGSYYVVANYAERFLCGGLMMDANYREWYGGAPTAGTQRVAGFCVRP